MSAPAKAFYSCGICGAYHFADWDGDCREDQARHNPDELDARYGPQGWVEVPMPGGEEDYTG
jgi:hypothetical protein